MAAGERVRYQGKCRDRREPVEGVDPVVRFRNPVDGEVVVNDEVRGRVRELPVGSELVLVAVAAADAARLFCVGQRHALRDVVRHQQACVGVALTFPLASYIFDEVGVC